MFRYHISVQVQVTSSTSTVLDGERFWITSRVKIVNRYDLGFSKKCPAIHWLSLGELTHPVLLIKQNSVVGV